MARYIVCCAWVSSLVLLVYGLWEGGQQHSRGSFFSYPSWFLGIFPRLLALFQMFGDWGACRAHEGDVHAEQAVWRVQNVRGRKTPRARVGLTLTDSPHDPVSKPKPHGTGGCPGSPDKLYSDKPGWQGPEIFGWGLELRRSLLCGWGYLVLVERCSTRPHPPQGVCSLILQASSYRGGQDRKSSESIGL